MNKTQLQRCNAIFCVKLRSMRATAAVWINKNAILWIMNKRMARSIRLAQQTFASTYHRNCFEHQWLVYFVLLLFVYIRLFTSIKCDFVAEIGRMHSETKPNRVDTYILYKQMTRFAAASCFFSINSCKHSSQWRWQQLCIAQIVNIHDAIKIVYRFHGICTIICGKRATK